jgi:hypothetical protein
MRRERRQTLVRERRRPDPRVRTDRGHAQTLLADRPG